MQDIVYSCSRQNVQGLSCLDYLFKRGEITSFYSSGWNVKWCHSQLERQGPATQQRMDNWLSSSRLKRTCCVAGPRWHGAGAELVNVRGNRRHCDASFDGPKITTTTMAAGSGCMAIFRTESADASQRALWEPFSTLRSAKQQDYHLRLLMNIGRKQMFKLQLTSLFEVAPSRTDAGSYALHLEERRCAETTREPEGIAAAQLNKRHRCCVQILET